MRKSKKKRITAAHKAFLYKKRKLKKAVQALKSGVVHNAVFYNGNAVYFGSGIVTFGE